MSNEQLDTTDFSPRGVAFLDALSVLCRAHGIQIAVGGYDELQLHNLTDSEPVIHANGIADYLE